jgi:hypothetical protein
MFFVQSLITNMLRKARYSRKQIIRIVCGINLAGYVLLLIVFYRQFQSILTVAITAVVFVPFFYWRLNYLRRQLNS